MRSSRFSCVVGVAVVLSCAVPASAQQGAPAAPRGLRIGLKAGASLAKIDGELAFESRQVRKFGADWGFDAGVSVEIPISLRLSIQPEWHVVRKLTDLDLGGGADALRSKLSVNYTQIPLLAKFYPGDRTGLSSNFVVGPAAAVKLQASRETRVGTVIEDLAASQQVRNVDWSLVFGFGFEFHELFGALTIDARYNHGLSTVDSSRRHDAKWRSLYLLIGMTF